MGSNWFSEDAKRAYEVFKLQWLINHKYTLSDLMSELEMIRTNNDEEMTIPEIFSHWEYGYGFSSEIYPCFEEFLDVEYKTITEENTVANNWYTNFGSFKFNDEDGTSFTCTRPKEFTCEELESLPIALLWESGLDFELAGEDGCLGNWDMYTPLYNTHNGLLYLIPHSDSQNWRQGEEVTINGRTVDEEELHEIEKFFQN